MTRLFLSNIIPGVPTIFLVGIHRGEVDIGNTLFTNVLPKTFAFTAHEFVTDIHHADYVLFPHTVKSKRDPLLTEVERAKTLAKTAGKRLIVSVGGDLSHDIFIRDAIVLKGSQYASLKRNNEIIVVPSAEDFADTMPIVPREKGERPVVSFCGWAGFPSPAAYCKYAARNAALESAALLMRQPKLRARKKGLYWRRRALRALRDPRIDLRAIVRNSFSANAKTIRIDPSSARKEYIQNMFDSDFVLAPKGDGNFSVRFYEALSMGRIPVLIDTDVVLPLQNLIAYEGFILRVPMKDVPRLADIIHSFYTSLAPGEFLKMQQRARDAFVRYLRIDSFFNELFSSVLVPERMSR